MFVRDSSFSEIELGNLTKLFGPIRANTSGDASQSQHGSQVFFGEAIFDGPERLFKVHGDLAISPVPTQLHPIAVSASNLDWANREGVSSLAPTRSDTTSD